ncbi:tRNA-modifying protein YgfZ [Photobacterium rosenbergii]|uniref:tRNA-modifying protein YgfZ n=1 Tax=Photobacterium rosenbergii TaxID=294936 RepID=A0A2T3N5T2_9GAMM|nr:tRNA-modifying protein YgfZ [Photobacterium rosenbergii]PSW07845.1 tRNA-modifying protein YgfZ [Photobacterium rosenbergii]
MSNWSENLNFDRISLSSGDALPSLALIELSNWALVTLIGDDKKSYLHGQVTCDVVGLAADQSTLAGHCDAKGKLRTVFRLFHHNDGYGFLQRRSIMDTQLPELKKYAIFSKVDIEASNDILLGIAGSEADTQVAQLFGGEGDVRAIDGGTAVKVDSQRWLLALNAEAAGVIANKLADSAVLSDDSLWDLYDILAAIPRVDTATELEFIPQAVNLQALDGISFTKGCYTGQETVARAKYRGINKRAMYIVSGPAENSPQAGDSLERSVGENWRKGGTIVAGYQFNDGQATALVVLPSDLDEGTTFRLAGTEGVWQQQALPYSLDDSQ